LYDTPDIQKARPMHDATGQYYDTHAEQLAVRYRGADVTALHILLRRWLPTSGSVLEIGCGIGRESAFTSALGIDPVEAPLKYRLQNRLHGGTFLLVGHGLFVLSLCSATPKDSHDPPSFKLQPREGVNSPFLNLQTKGYTPGGCGRILNATPSNRFLNRLPSARVLETK